MKYQTIGGLATLVRHRGPTTLPGAPPQTSGSTVILCLHDAGGNGGVFDALLDELDASQSPPLSPMAFDLPGHGRSGGLDALASIEAMADHAAGVLDGYGLGSVSVVGEGMGAAVGLTLAGRRPDLVASAVLVGDVALDYRLDDEIASLVAVTSGRARREFDRSGYAPETGRPVYQRAFAEWVKTDPRATLGDRRAESAWEAPTVLPCPTLVVIGEFTEDGPRAEAEAVAGLDGGSVAPLAGAGRRAVLEQPAALARLIENFVGGLS